MGEDKIRNRSRKMSKGYYEQLKLIELTKIQQTGWAVRTAVPTIHNHCRTSPTHMTTGSQITGKWLI